MRIARGRIIWRVFLNTFFRMSTWIRVKGFVQAAAPGFLSIVIDMAENRHAKNRCLPRKIGHAYKVGYAESNMPVKSDMLVRSHACKITHGLSGVRGDATGREA
jgi:hypothetical protein